MDREKTLERIKDMINPAYFEDAVAWREYQLASRKKAGK